MIDIKSILTAKISYGHLIFLTISIWIFIGLLTYLVLPLFFWAFWGAGASSSHILDLPLSEFIFTTIPFVFGIVIIGIGTYRNVKKKNLSKVKSFAIVGLSLLIFYPWRTEILDFVILICRTISD